jgi:Protein of unknown function (DUF3313)
MNTYKTKLTGVLMLMIIAAMGFSGCGAQRARDVKQSGFLGDYSMLEKTREQDDTLYLYSYNNPKANWPSYSKILLDPIVIWRRAELQQDGAPMADLQRVANNFYQILHNELSKDYEMVQEPGPRTMRIQVALTDVEASWAAVDTVTSVIPVGIGISAGKEFITGKPSFVGEASVEAKITDAQTGQLLFALVDRRVGGNEIEVSVDSWDDVNKIIEIWSKLGRFRLCRLRSGQDCLSPL